MFYTIKWLLLVNWICKICVLWGLSMIRYYESQSVIRDGSIRGINYFDCIYPTVSSAFYETSKNSFTFLLRLYYFFICRIWDSQNHNFQIAYRRKAVEHTTINQKGTKIIRMTNAQFNLKLALWNYWHSLVT